MQVYGINNYKLKQNFEGKFVENFSLKTFRSGLSSRDRVVFNRIMNQVEEIKDKREFIFDSVSIVTPQKIRKYVSISLRGKNGVFQSIVADKPENTLKMFKNFIALYKTEELPKLN